jgi:predicted nuclease of predicted toxin-antitoxin system
MNDPIKFYTAEHIPKTVADGLRRRGVDVLTTQEAGMLGVSDEEQLAFAANQGRVFLTGDDDFFRLHAQGIQHVGIVYTNRQTPIGQIIRGLMLIYEVLDASDMQNHIEYV